MCGVRSFPNRFLFPQVDSFQCVFFFWFALFVSHYTYMNRYISYWIFILPYKNQIKNPIPTIFIFNSSQYFSIKHFVFFGYFAVLNDEFLSTAITTNRNWMSIRYFGTFSIKTNRSGVREILPTIVKSFHQNDKEWNGSYGFIKLTKSIVVAALPQWNITWWLNKCETMLTQNNRVNFFFSIGFSHRILLLLLSM